MHRINLNLTDNIYTFLVGTFMKKMLFSFVTFTTIFLCSKLEAAQANVFEGATQSEMFRRAQQMDAGTSSTSHVWDEPAPLIKQAQKDAQPSLTKKQQKRLRRLTELQRFFPSEHFEQIKSDLLCPPNLHSLSQATYRTYKNDLPAFKNAFRQCCSILAYHKAKLVTIDGQCQYTKNKNSSAITPETQQKKCILILSNLEELAADLELNKSDLHQLFESITTYAWKNLAYFPLDERYINTLKIDEENRKAEQKKVEDRKRKCLAKLESLKKAVSSEELFVLIRSSLLNKLECFVINTTPRTVEAAFESFKECCYRIAYEYIKTNLPAKPKSRSMQRVNQLISDLENLISIPEVAEFQKKWQDAFAELTGLNWENRNSLLQILQSRTTESKPTETVNGNSASKDTIVAQQKDSPVEAAEQTTPLGDRPQDLKKAPAVIKSPNVPKPQAVRSGDKNANFQNNKALLLGLYKAVAKKPAAEPAKPGAKPTAKGPALPAKPAAKGPTLPPLSPAKPAAKPAATPVNNEPVEEEKPVTPASAKAHLEAFFIGKVSAKKGPGKVGAKKKAGGKSPAAGGANGANLLRDITNKRTSLLGADDGSLKKEQPNNKLMNKIALSALGLGAGGIISAVAYNRYSKSKENVVKRKIDTKHDHEPQEPKPEENNQRSAQSVDRKTKETKIEVSRAA